MDKNFIGRDKEIEILQKYYESDKTELVAVYGRRRVGKTFLIRETMEKFFDFEYVGMHKTPAKDQRSQFQRNIDARTGSKGKTPKDWFEAFDNLKQYLLSTKKKKVVVFLDELPWMDTPKSNFLSAFSYFINTWGIKDPILKLFVCGSATTWMLDKLIGDRGGLYGRITRPVYLSPFSLKETEEYLNKVKKMKYGKLQVLNAYMIFGGIPFYLNMLDNDQPLSVNVDTLFFSVGAPLRTEYEFLFRSLFKDSVNYRKVIELLATKLCGLTREEILDGTKIEGGELTTILENLNSCDFIRCYSDPVKKERSKVYQLTDLFSLFYLRFVQKNDGQDEQFWTNLGNTGKKNAWSGYAFEQVCLHHIQQIKQKLGISGILSNAYAWSSKAYTDKDGNEWDGGQIDLIIDRNDNVMNLCEMKYSSDEYTIDKAYSDKIRKRTSSFKNQVKTKKDLRCTFVTINGIKKNANSNIVDNQIVMEDLFT
ncbi:AAA family ATPase [Butyrivibrio sp. INlla14]|uniref:AAA family ATPase n=1 Tax=Butyrivibrio sp. INlla14 TaxID=1520808 RepID=UPI000876BAAA|nr:ATP-binding protein [Butyrivibrio sp. INlla14]SCX95476.1 hypothetical protein SAMN02910371_00509 [Butyrivibrio sp. INlla14]